MAEPDLLPWMTDFDIHLLEYLDSLDSDRYEQISINPTTAYVNLAVRRDVIDKKQNTFLRRMRMQYKVGLLERVEDARGTHYYITDLGRDFIANEHDPVDLIPPDDF